MSIAFPLPPAATAPATGSAAMPQPAPETTPVDGASGAAAPANPFSHLLAGLEALQQPAVTAPLPADETPKMPAAPDAQLSPQGSPPAAEANAVFMGPAFNSRLALAQTDQLAQPLAAKILVEAQTPVTTGEPMSLLTMLAGKFKAQTLDTANAPSAPQPEGGAEAAPEAKVPETIMVSHPGDIATEKNVETPDSAPQDKTEAPDPALMALTLFAAPDIAAPKPVVLAPVSAPVETPATLEHTSEATSSSARISLFDKLSKPDRVGAAVAEMPETTADAFTDSGLAIAVAADDKKLAAPLPQPLHAQAAQSDTSLASAAPAAPTVTMRPNTPAQLVEGVSVLVVRAGKSAINEFVIRMDPPELGRIDVQLKMHEDGTVQAVIASDNASTYDLLRREASTIERALSDSGFRTGSDGLSFNLKQQGGENARGALPFGGGRQDPAAIDDPLPAAVLTPLRQRYENARVNITA
jgi:flagellar hook-length control protein FliK